MKAMELVLILVPIFLFVLIRSAMEQRAQARSERTKLLEEALRNPAIDRPTLTSLAHQLTGVKPPSTNGAGPSSGGGLQALLLALGWLTLFVGLGVWVLGEMTDSSDACAGGVLTSLIGFGLVTYPFALRELQARRPS